MAQLTETRRRFRVAAIVLAVLIVAAGAYLVVPLGPDAAARAQELATKGTEARNLELQVRPLRTLPTLLAKSQQDIGKFYQTRLPARYSDIHAELGKLAARNGVRLEDAKYETVEIGDVPQLQAVKISASVSGGYGSLARFINAVERDQAVFLLIESLALGDKQGGRIALDLKMETYLRSGTAPAQPGTQRTGD